MAKRRKKRRTAKKRRTKKRRTKKRRTKKRRTKKRATRKRATRKKRRTTKKRRTKKRRNKKRRTKKRRATRKKKTRKKKKRKANAAFMAPVRPSKALAAVVGSKPIPRTQVVKKLWAYIRKHKLQDKKNRRMINADAKLKAVFRGKKKVSMFDMMKHVNRNVS